MTSTDDLIALLRVPMDVNLRAGAPELDEYDDERRKAADRLTALQDRVNALEGALRCLAEPLDPCDCADDHCSVCGGYHKEVVDAARAVLSKGEKG